MWSKLIAEASSLDFVLKKANVIYSRTWDSTRTSTRVVPLSWSPEKTVMEIPLFTNFKFCLSWSITSTLDTWLGFYFLILIFLFFKAALPVFVSVTLLTSERGLDFNGHILRLRVCLKRGALQQASHDEHEVVKNT